MARTNKFLTFFEQNKFLIFIPIFYTLFFIFKESFVYKSYFFFGSFLLFVSCCVFFSSFYKQKSQSFKINFTIIFAFLLIIMPFLIWLITNRIGFEVTFYYICVFALFIVFSFRQNNINILKINKLIIAFALCEAIICILQSLKIVTSTTIFFEVAGISTNPNVTAMFIVMSFPAIISFFSKGNGKILCLIIGIELIALILLKSRTAFLGVCVIAFCLFLKNYYNNRKIIAIISVCVVLIGILAVPKLYNFKKDSADGRFFIWKVATEMIIDKPLGYGYGTIVNSYNKAQSVYIQTHTTTKQEQNNAEFTYNLMNDYLEMAVMGGIAGGILYLTFIISILLFGLKYSTCHCGLDPQSVDLQSRRKNKAIAGQARNDSTHQARNDSILQARNDKRDFYAFLGVLGFAVMGLMNFAFFAPQIALLFAYYSAISAKNAKTLCEIKPNKSIFLGLGLVFLFVACGYIYARFKVNSAYNLLDSKNITEAKTELQKLKLFTSNEIYHRCFGDCYFAEKDFENALICYSKAVEYAYQPKTLIKMANCDFHLKNYDKAVEYLHSASSIQPVLFEPHYCEMMIYLNSGNFEKAQEKANFILKKEIKFQNKKIDFFKEQANKVLKINKLQ